MLEQLITEGEGLLGQVTEALGIKQLHGVEFETWATKVVQYISDRDSLNYSIIERVENAYKALNPSNSYNFYTTALGVLKSL